MKKTSPSSVLNGSSPKETDLKETEVQVAPRISGFAGILRTFESLQNHSFRIFWFSMLFTFSAMQMSMLTRSWYMFKLTNSAVLLGLVGVAMGVPLLCFSLLGGTLADRISKRAILVVGQVVLAIVNLALGLIITLGAISPVHLLGAAVFQGFFMALVMPARQSFIPELVENRQLFNAISLNTLQMNITRIAAPSIAGFLIAGIGVEKVFYVMAVLYVLSSIVLLSMPPVPRAAPKGERRAVLREMGEGLRYVWLRHEILLVLAIALVATLLGMPFMQLLPLFSEQVLNVGPHGVFFLMSMMGVGALVGSIYTASLGDYKSKGKLLLALVTLSGVTIVVFCLTAANLPQLLLLSLLVMAPVGFAQSGRMTSSTTLIMANTDVHMRGRVMALYMMEVGLEPLGIMPVAYGAELIGAPWALGIAGGLIAVIGVGFWLFSPTLRKLP